MTERDRKRPTDAELKILRVLWRRGAGTVRQVHRALNRTRPTGYTTTLKQMQVMTAKGLLVREESRRPQLYRAAFSQDETQRQLLDHLIDGAFGGSASRLVMQALRARDVSAEEIQQIEGLLNELEGDEP
jgi:predicted transcriptional regulator